MAMFLDSTPAPTVQPFGSRAVGDCRFLTEAEVLALLGEYPAAVQPTQANNFEAADLALAQMRHARRALEGALEHGAALLATLGLPRLVEPDFVATDPTEAGDALEAAFAVLDAIDSPDDDIEDDDPLEKVGDEELDLGWSALHSQIHLGNNTEDGDATALERAGRGFIRSGNDDAEDGGDAESEDYENGSDDGEDINHFASSDRFTLQPLTEAQRQEIAVLMRRVATVRRMLHV